MKIYDLVKKYGQGKGENVMWSSIQWMSDAIEPLKESNPGEYWRIVKGMYAAMCGEHFNEEFGKWQVEQMYYEDKAGNKHYAPYWSEEKVKSIYELNKHKIPSEYTCWDFYVTMNMIKSDNYCMLKDWFPNASEEELNGKLVCMAVNYLNDSDAPHPTSKIWNYFNK